LVDSRLRAKTADPRSAGETPNTQIQRSPRSHPTRPISVRIPVPSYITILLSRRKQRSKDLVSMPAEAPNEETHGKAWKKAERKFSR